MFSLVGCWGWGFARLGLLVAGAFARLRRLGLLVGSSVDWPHTKFVHSKFSLLTALRTMVSVSDFPRFFASLEFCSRTLHGG